MKEITSDCETKLIPRFKLISEDDRNSPNHFNTHKVFSLYDMLNNKKFICQIQDQQYAELILRLLNG